MRSKYVWFSLLLIVAAFLVSGLLYSRLPAQIPSHWNINGQVDGYTPKPLGAFLMPGIMLGLLAMCFAFLWLSPRNYEVQRSGETYDYVIFCVMAMLCYVHLMSLYAALGRVPVDRAMTAGLCVFFGLIGNVMPRMKRNFWMGIRTPWTLASESVWDRSHRFGAKCFVVTAAVAFLLTVTGAPMPVVFVALIGGLLLPVPYSLYVSKQEQSG